MKDTSLITCLALTALLTGCSNLKITSESDPAYRFSGIKTYQWIEAPAEYSAQDEVRYDIDLQQALNNELASFGWNEVLDASNATVQIAYCIHIEAHSEYTQIPSDDDREFSGGLVFNPSDGEWNYEERPPEQIEYMIETGTLHVLMYDSASRNRVWYGKVVTELDRRLAPDKRDERYREIARKLFEQLPR